MKKILYIVLCILLFGTLGCKEDKTQPQTNAQSIAEQYIEKVLSSEASLTGLSKCSSIYDEDLELYYQTLIMQIERGELLKTSVVKETKVINTDASNPGITYVEETSNFVTIGSKKYETINGTEVTTAYDEPKYFLDFSLSEDYFQENYILEGNLLKADIKDEFIDEFFLGKVQNNVNELSIELTLENDKLHHSKIAYVTDSGFTTSIEVTYSYEHVNITH